MSKIQKIEIPFSRLNILTRLQNVRVAVSENAGFVVGTAIGLALEGLRKPKNPAINFLKDDFAKQSQTLRIFILGHLGKRATLCRSTWVG